MLNTVNLQSVQSRNMYFLCQLICFYATTGRAGELASSLFQQKIGLGSRPASRKWSIATGDRATSGKRLLEGIYLTLVCTSLKGCGEELGLQLTTRSPASLDKFFILQCGEPAFRQVGGWDRRGLVSLVLNRCPPENGRYSVAGVLLRLHRPVGKPRRRYWLWAEV